MACTLTFKATFCSTAFTDIAGRKRRNSSNPSQRTWARRSCAHMSALPKGSPLLAVRSCRRSLGLGLTSAATLLLGSGWGRWENAANAEDALVIRVADAPDQSKYDPNDQALREAARMLQEALGAPSVEAEEAGWTKIITKFEGVEADWSADIVGRAYGNRGNARSRQGKFDAALLDYNKSIELCPWSVDPVLNRGVLFENTGRLGLAEQDYRAVLAANPQDPSAWNNLGNVQLGTGQPAEALKSLDQATRLAPDFAFAAVNHALAQFELGKTNLAIKELRTTLRRYPDFPEARAALVAALWADGLEVQAETEWQRVNDPRYSDKTWLKSERRWPTRVRTSLEAFRDLKSITSS